MNNLLAAACLTVSLTSATPAKGPKDNFPKTVQARATTLTQALAQRIHLNEGQYVRIKQLHLRYLNERHEMEKALASAPATERDAQMAAAQQRYEQDLNALLYPEQRVAYQQLRASFTAHRL